MYIERQKNLYETTYNMSINSSKIAHNTIALYGRLVITSIIGLITTRLLLNTLGVINYGIYSVVGGIVALTALINTIMIAATNRFITYELGKGNIVRTNTVFNVTFVIHIMIALFVVVVGFPVGEWYIDNYLNVDPNSLPKAFEVYKLSLIGAVALFLSVPFEGLLMAKENYLSFCLRDVAISLLKLLSVILIGYVGKCQLILYCFSLMILNFVQTAWNYLYCKKHYRDIVRFKYVKQWNEYKKILNFSIWTGYGAIASVGKVQGANLLVNSFFGVALNSAMGIATSVNNIIVSFATSIGRAITPQITKNYAQGDVESSLELVSRSCRYSVMILIIPIAVLWVCLDEILSMWLGVVPEGTSMFIRLMLIDAVVGAMANGIPDFIFATGSIKKYQLIVQTLFLLSLPLAYIALSYKADPSYLYYSYIFISLLSVYVRHLLLIEQAKNTSLSYAKKTYLPSILLFALTAFWVYIVDMFAFSCIVKGVIVLCGVLFLCYYIGLSIQEQKTIRSLFISRITNN